VRIDAADRRLRSRFAEVLSGLRGKAGTAFLVKLLRTREGENAPDARTRVLVLGLLAARRNERVREALFAALADPEATVRAAAAPALASNAGRDALGLLKEARGREVSPLVQSALDRAIRSLGGTTGPRPPRPPVPVPAPPPRLTREAALDRARAKGKVLWVRDDPAEKALAWISVEGRFVLRFDARAGALDAFEEYLAMSGRAGATARAIAFTDGHVWVASTRGVLAYDRRRRSWSPYAVNLDPGLLDVPVADVMLEKGAVVFTLGDGRRFAFDPKTKRWRKF